MYVAMPAMYRFAPMREEAILVTYMLWSHPPPSIVIFYRLPTKN